MAKRIKGRELTSDEIKEITSLTKKDITNTKLKDLFAVREGQTAAKFQPNDYFTLMPNKFYNKTAIKTTAGRYVYNILCMPEPYLKKYGFVNTAITKKVAGSIEDQMGEMILNDELTTKEYASWMDNSEWLCMSMAYYISPSMSKSVIVSRPDIIKHRDELFDQYKKELEDGDINVTNKIEKELVSMAQKEVEADDDASYDYYKSGMLDFKSSYKKCSLMIGAISDLATGKLRVLKSNYIDGVSSDEYADTANLTIIGGYSRGVATQKYGYETKKYNAALNNVIIDNDELDCGTDKYINIHINSATKNLFLYRFVIEGSKLVELTPENIDNYVDKDVKLRSPMTCKNPKLCVHCAGTLYKRMNIDKVGTICSNMTGRLLNLSMKKMHNSTVKINKIDVEEFIKER